MGLSADLVAEGFPPRAAATTEPSEAVASRSDVASDESRDGPRGVVVTASGSLASSAHAESCDEFGVTFEVSSCRGTSGEAACDVVAFGFESLPWSC